MYYFGCWGCLGHYLYDSQQRSVNDDKSEIPHAWRRGALDGAFAPRRGSGRYSEEYPQGVAAHTSKDGWTLIAFWDRTGDSRGNSSSTFLAKGDFTFEQMVAMAKFEFPDLWKRFRFEVKKLESPERMP